MPDGNHPGRRRWRRRLFLAAYLLVLLEIALQLAGAWNNYRLRRLELDGNGTILCFGDSFTYGIGAPAGQSYPDHLQRLLAKRCPGRAIQVDNLGRPGSNSSQCRQLVTGQLSARAPELVLIMTGFNNCWNFIAVNQALLREQQPGNSLRLRLRAADALLSRIRLYKLVRLLGNNPMELLPVDQRHFRTCYPVRSPEVAGLLERANHLLGQADYANAEPLYHRVLTLHPNDYEPHWKLGRLLNYRGERELARQEFMFAARQAPSLIVVSCILADMYDRRQPRTSAEFRRFTGQVAELRAGWAEKFGEENVSTVIDPMVSPDQSLAAQILKNDIRAIHAMVAARGSRMAILSYPLPAAAFQQPESIYYELADELQVPFVNNSDYFSGLLQSHAAREIFTTDGHCNSSGYLLLATNIVNTLFP